MWTNICFLGFGGWRWRFVCSPTEEIRQSNTRNWVHSCFDCKGSIKAGEQMCTTTLCVTRNEKNENIAVVHQTALLHYHKKMPCLAQAGFLHFAIFEWMITKCSNVKTLRNKSSFLRTQGFLFVDVFRLLSDEKWGRFPKGNDWRYGTHVK